MPHKLSINTLARTGDLAGVQGRLQEGVPVDFIDNGRARTTPLQEAAWGGHVEIVRLLIAAGANLDEIDGSGFSARHYIAKRCGLRWKRRLAEWIGPSDADAASGR